MQSRLTKVLSLIGATLLLSSCGGALGNNSSTESDWPSEDIHINIHSGPGNLDSAIRQIAPIMEEELDAKVIIDNRPGGGQEVSEQATMAQPADGYTLQTLTSSTSFGMALGQISASPGEWSIIKSLQVEPAAIAVPKDSEMKNVGDFVEAMKDSSKDVNVGGYQNDGFMRFVYYKLGEAADYDGKWIPIDTTDRVSTSLQGGHLDAAVMTPSTALSAVKNGDVRLLGIAADERSEYYPEVETFNEQGYEITETLYRGLMVKSETPEPVRQKLEKALDSATQSSKWKTFQETNQQSNDSRSPDEMDEVLTNEVEERVEFLKTIGLK